MLWKMGCKHLSSFDRGSRFFVISTLSACVTSLVCVCMTSLVYVYVSVTSLVCVCVTSLVGRWRGMFLRRPAGSSSRGTSRPRRGEWSSRRWEHDRCWSSILASVHVLVGPRSRRRLRSHRSRRLQSADGVGVCTRHQWGHASRRRWTHWRRSSLRDWTGSTSARRHQLIVIMLMTVLSPWRGHCESSPGSFGECRLSARWPPTLRPSQPTCLVSPAVGRCHSVVALCLAIGARNNFGCA